MAWDFRQQLRELSEGASRSLNRLRQRGFLEALLAAYSLMLHASSELNPTETRQRLLSFLESSEVLAGFSSTDVDQQLQQHRQLAEFEPQSAARQWLKQVGSIREQTDLARLLVRVVMAVVGGSAALNDAQRQVVVSLCSELQLPLADFLEQHATPQPSPPEATPTPAVTTAPVALPPERQLQAGERVPLASLNLPVNGGLQLQLEGSPELPTRADPGAFLLDAHSRVRGDGDMVFYNQPVDAAGAVSLQAGLGFALNLARVPEAIQRLAFTLSVAQAQDFQTLGEIRLRLYAAGCGGLVFPLHAGQQGETAMVLGELYRHREGWRFAAVGQGYRGGLAAMCERYGVQVQG